MQNAWRISKSNEVDGKSPLGHSYNSLYSHMAKAWPRSGKSVHVFCLLKLSRQLIWEAFHYKPAEKLPTLFNCQSLVLYFPGQAWARHQNLKPQFFIIRPRVCFQTVMQISDVLLSFVLAAISKCMHHNYSCEICKQGPVSTSHTIQIHPNPELKGTGQWCFSCLLCEVYTLVQKTGPSGPQNPTHVAALSPSPLSKLVWTLLYGLYHAPLLHNHRIT